MPSSCLLIVTEGINDVRLLRTILHGHLMGDTRYFAAQGRVSLATVARNLLVDEGGPVLVVMDADTLKPHLWQERQSMVRLAMSAVGVPGLFDVFTFVPEMEVVFFEVPATLEKVIGSPVPPEMLEEGRLAPKRTLARILAAASIPNLEALIQKLDEPAMENLAKGSQAASLREKVLSLGHFVNVPVN
jgi:hypothetical protein